LDRTCFELHRVLLDRCCWEPTFQNVGLPPCPPDLSPHQYATLVFNPLCQVGVSCLHHTIMCLTPLVLLPFPRNEGILAVSCPMLQQVSGYQVCVHAIDVLRVRSRPPVSGHTVGCVSQTPTTSTFRMFSWGKVSPFFSVDDSSPLIAHPRAPISSRGYRAVRNSALAVDGGHSWRQHLPQASQGDDGRTISGRDALANEGVSLSFPSAR